MDSLRLDALLRAVAAGDLPIEAAAQQLAASRDLGFAQVDVHRTQRTGDPEVVYAATKQPAQTTAIVAALRAAEPDRAALVTRADPATVDALRARWPDLVSADGTAVIGPLPPPRGTVAVVTAGTSDATAATEAALTIRAFGANVDQIHDVGVAGLHRLVAVRDRLAAAHCVVVVAGMEGALPSVIAGLVGTPIVGIPTSVGYGVGAGGFAALFAMLTSCAPGVVVVNIDNGFGAGVHAARVARATSAGAVDP